jgi:hypothetical protein
LNLYFNIMNVKLYLLNQEISNLFRCFQPKKRPFMTIIA